MLAMAAAAALAAGQPCGAQDEPVETVDTIPVEGAREQTRAAGASDLVLEEIIVTARRSSESLATVPLAIDAISESTISERGISQAGDVADLSAGLVFDEGLVPTDTRPVIRSLSSNRGRANVATLIDNVDVSGESMTTGGGGLTANMRLLDLERIEVVKGPQSVLYGRSAFSGAVYYVSKRPSYEREGELSVSVADHGTREMRLSASGPVLGAMRGRVNLAQWQTDGAYRNPNTGSALGDGDSLGGALALEWTPTEEFGLYARLENSSDHYGQRPAVMLRSLLQRPPGNRDAFGISHGVVAPPAAHLPFQFDAANVANCANPANREFPYFDDELRVFCRPILVGPLHATESDVDHSRDARNGRLFAGTDVDNLRGHFEMNWAWGFNTLQSLTAFTRNRSRTQEDFDQTDFVLEGVNDPTVLQYGFSALADISHGVDQLSQEVRWSFEGERFSWFLSGLYWSETHDTDWNDLFWLREGGFDVFLLFGLQTATEPDTSTPTTVLKRETSHRSIAGSLSFSPVERLRLTVEGRYLREKQDYFGTGEDRGAVSALGTCDFLGNPRDSCPPGTNSVEDRKFVPRLTVDWETADGLFTYLTYAEGFKPGGIDTLSANADVTDGEYEPEELQTLELGAKSRLFGGRMQLNAAAFHYRYKNQQQNVQVLVNNTLSTNVVNVGRTDVNGIEFDLTYLVSGDLSASLGYVFTDAKYVDFNLARIAREAGTDALSSYGLADSGNAEGDFSGNQVRLTPRHTATANLRYERQLVVGGLPIDAFADLSARYTDKRFMTPGNRSWLPAHGIVDLAFGLDHGRWFAQLAVNNLLDDDTIRSGLPNPDYGFDSTAQGGISTAGLLLLPQPRTASAKLGYRF